ncbi:hypothetical protein Acsp03_00390 [Actinomadura sp. NBRC 104412]|uniref:hypothetical protein n=1 Tax=Actinomadura sp. NBRC 104412 TaxID=3032203 RepID=UPI0024A32C2A|nr:hypothetical protein [Actinomadura sp. NBRC 104412]GLZ02572.1 hypothetical protein Acsp03_00390 [Actinomadura sp. NBRC 104412]
MRRLRPTTIRRIAAVVGGTVVGILTAAIPVLGEPIPAGVTTLIALYTITGN